MRNYIEKLCLFCVNNKFIKVYNTISIVRMSIFANSISQVNTFLLFLMVYPITASGTLLPDSLLTREHIYEYTFSDTAKAARIIDLMRERRLAPEHVLDIGTFTVRKGDNVLIKDYSGDAPIVVEGDATITVENVNITSMGTVMTIKNGSTVKLKVKGINNNFTSTTSSGIAANSVDGSSTSSDITIEGDDRYNSKLTVVSGDRESGAGNDVVYVGIGFVGFGFNNGDKHCGDITISNITIDVTAGRSMEGHYNGAAIGLSAKNPGTIANVICGKIEIKDSDVTCRMDKTSTAACIGASHWESRNASNLEMGGIYIENSTITASSGANTDFDLDPGICIGFGQVVSNGGSITMKRIEINKSILNLTSMGPYSVGKVKDFCKIEEGIVVDGDSKGEKWNPDSN